MAEPPRWLGTLQGLLSGALSGPLSTETGTFQPSLDAYPELLLAEISGAPVDEDGPGACNVPPGLRLYHTQYWVRLFETFQSIFPRFSEVVGHWQFNQLVSLHLQGFGAQPFDLAACAEGFAEARLKELALMEASQPGRKPRCMPLLQANKKPAQLLRQALGIDEAERHVFLADFQGIWHPAPAELARLAHGRVLFATSFRLVAEDWDLARRSSLTRTQPIQGSGFATPLGATRHWVFYRTTDGCAHRLIEPALATLLRRCQASSFGAALAETQQACSKEQALQLETELTRWINLALSSGWWQGVE